MEILSAYLLAGTPPSPLSSHCIVATLSQSEGARKGVDFFEQLGVWQSVVQKVQESVGTDRPTISRPAREARDLINSLESK